MVRFKPSVLLFLVGLLGLLGLSTACQPADDGGGATAPRFEVHPVYATGQGPMVVRFDTATGGLQSASLVGGRNWKPLGEPVNLTGTPGRFGFNFAEARSIPLTFIRIDTQTGDVWRMAYPRDQDWVAFRGEGEAASAAQASTPAPRKPAPVRAVPAPKPTPAPIAAKAERKRPGTAPEDIDAYIEGFESENLPTEMRAWAVEQLGNVESPDAIPPLLKALESGDASIVRSAIRALARQDDPRVRPALEKMVHHATPEIGRVAKAELDKLP